MPFCHLFLLSQQVTLSVTSCRGLSWKVGIFSDYNLLSPSLSAPVLSTKRKIYYHFRLTMIVLSYALSCVLSCLQKDFLSSVFPCLWSLFFCICHFLSASEHSKASLLLKVAFHLLYPLYYFSSWLQSFIQQYLLSARYILLHTEYEEKKETQSLLRIGIEWSASRIPVRFPNLSFIFQSTTIRFLYLFETTLAKITSD